MLSKDDFFYLALRVAIMDVLHWLEQMKRSSFISLVLNTIYWPQALLLPSAHKWAPWS